MVLFQPDIPQNTGAMLRLAACLGVAVDIIEPCGFVLDDRRLRRAALDYGDAADVMRHASWTDYRAARHEGRLVLLTTKASTPLPQFIFDVSDRIMLGRETAGVTEEAHAASDCRVIVPMRPGQRSLNVAQTAAIALYEALRQTGGLACG